MDADEWSVMLPLTAAAWEAGKTDDLERAVEEDLTHQIDDLADDGCQSGGWPEDVMAEADGVTISRSELRVDVTIYFTEVIASGCQDMPHRVRRDIRLRMSLRPGETVGRVEHSISDPAQWDLIDRNSAADGA